MERNLFNYHWRDDDACLARLAIDFHLDNKACRHYDGARGSIYGSEGFGKNATMGYTGGIAWLIAIVAMAFSGILDTWSLIGVGLIALGIIIDLIRTRLNGEAVA